LYIDRIFDMFYRASEISYGSGLGLYIVKNAVAKLHGSINVESVLGEGTKFTVVIPNLIKNIEKQ
jgi:signal transduction histidine kinase